MAWLQIDDNVPLNRKMLAAGPSACWLWLCGIAYCQRQLTDGFIPELALPMLGVTGTARAIKLAAVLVEAGLFEAVEGGYRVHDYHDHNATAEEASAHRLAVSAKRATAGRLGGIRSGIARREATKQNASNAYGSNEAPTLPYRRTPLTPLADAKGASAGRVTRALRKQAAEVLRIRFGRCQHDPPCANYAACVLAVVEELRARAS